ncbi:ComEA family DNA-binding protein [Glaciecola sp. SC05]|uniref:ComEA family DNA-binding protein n=1 Tax=Glaciecola sp. SC05 TaxID=1987355 RepID=UPI003527A129
MKVKTWFAALGLVLTTLFSTAALANGPDRATPASAVVSVVNINTADIDTLSSLPGIGPKKAESIVSYRELNGNFQSVDELSNVKGIGKRMVEKLADKVSI